MTDPINQATTAEIEMTVALPAQQQGTHMSRMVQVIDTHLQVVNPYDLSRFYEVCRWPT